MDLEELLNQRFSKPLRAYLTKQAVILNEEVSPNRLETALIFYENKGDFFVAADLAQALGNQRKRKEMLNQAASDLIKTKDERDVEWKRSLRTVERKHLCQEDYSPIKERDGFLGGLVVGDFNFTTNNRRDLNEGGNNVEKSHIEAIRSVLRGDLTEAKQKYTQLLNLVERINRRVNKESNVMRIKPEEELSLALEIGYFDRAFEICERYGMNHYGGILARYLGEEKLAERLFNRQIRLATSKRRYGHAAFVAELKGDLVQVVELLAKDQNYSRLIELVVNHPELNDLIEQKMREGRRFCLRQAESLFLTYPDLNEEGRIKLGLEDRKSIWERTKYKITTKLFDHNLRRSERIDRINAAILISQKLGENDIVSNLKRAVYHFAKEDGDATGMVYAAIDIGEENLFREVLSFLDGRDNPNLKVQLLIGSKRWDEALVLAQDYQKRQILEEAGRFEDLCDLIERGKYEEVHIGSGICLGKIDAYRIAVEHQLIPRANRLYSELVEERKQNRETDDRYPFSDLAEIIIERRDADLAREIVIKSMAELQLQTELSEDEAISLKKYALVAKYLGEEETADIFTTVSRLALGTDTLHIKTRGLGQNEVAEFGQLEVLKPLRRYEKYVKLLEN